MLQDGTSKIILFCEIKIDVKFLSNDIYRKADCASRRTISSGFSFSGIDLRYAILQFPLTLTQWLSNLRNEEWLCDLKVVMRPFRTLDIEKWKGKHNRNPQCGVNITDDGTGTKVERLQIHSGPEECMRFSEKSQAMLNLSYYIASRYFTEGWDDGIGDISISLRRPTRLTTRLARQVVEFSFSYFIASPTTHSAPPYRKTWIKKWLSKNGRKTWCDGEKEETVEQSFMPTKKSQAQRETHFISLFFTAYNVSFVSELSSCVLFPLNIYSFNSRSPFIPEIQPMPTRS